MELIQQIIAGVVVVGGAGTVVYYSIGQSSGTSIEEHVKSQKRTLILVSEDEKGQAKENLYKILDEKSDEMIAGVTNKDWTKTKVGMGIRDGCEKTRSKVFTGYEDKTYQSFSQGCVEGISIATKLELEKLEDGSTKSGKLEDRIKDLNDPTKNIIDPSGIKRSGKKEITEQDLQGWCATNKVNPFKHEMDLNYLDVKKGCFSSKEEPKTAKPNAGAVGGSG